MVQSIRIALREQMRRQKANAATGLPEMIEIATGKYFKENREDKHKRDAKKWMVSI